MTGHYITSAAKLLDINFDWKIHKKFHSKALSYSTKTKRSEMTDVVSLLIEAKVNYLMEDNFVLDAFKILILVLSSNILYNSFVYPPNFYKGLNICSSFDETTIGVAVFVKTQPMGSILPYWNEAITNITGVTFDQMNLCLTQINLHMTENSVLTK